MTQPDKSYNVVLTHDEIRALIQVIDDLAIEYDPYDIWTVAPRPEAYTARSKLLMATQGD